MPRPGPSVHPIQSAIEGWLSSVEPHAGQDLRAGLLSSAPKRYTIYEPMVLLPSGSFSSKDWVSELGRHPEETVAALWSSILYHLSSSSNAKKKQPLTHLAINEGIPLHKGDSENIRRSPSGLRMLHGDFGPSSEDADFKSAFWVSTKQNGIYQTWAPRWTMFSRGNVKEKTRLLVFPASKSCAVDLYAGIGYFTFCYASLGKTVFCWEINPWSVEALRRGAIANGWKVKVIQGDELALPTEDVVAESEAQIFVFLEDNACAEKRITAIQQHSPRNVEHVNCGFLPTSRPTWGAALAMTRTNTDAGSVSYLHLHENVGESDIPARKEEIEQLLKKQDRVGREIKISHTEKVKTYAPGVWHCVFDVCIEPK